MTQAKVLHARGNTVRTDDAAPRWVGRRELLLGGAALTTAAVSGPCTAVAQTPPGLRIGEPAYRETEHVRTFYARARF